MRFFQQVYNGISKNTESLIELEGSILDDRTAISTSNTMLVYFHSDGGISYSGFTAHYMAQSSGTWIQGGVANTSLGINLTTNTTERHLAIDSDMQSLTEDMSHFILV